ncbi:hypothetical protein HPB50_025130 [Hyalomma asiaticum]|uniref:Uncharacterized protein n=1 Tax=Hyalomma asiaticum TaxID=266040 RepID=A0ACB7RRJ2_HYAAI|nr:hypothetical protein HPB50_025130 [Hyalomma asiaticum]
MRKDIQYRDLPGGPLMVKFADELPLGTLCSRCGMLSKDMYEDPSSHAFCSICIFECSDRKKIHCKYENKDVSVDEVPYNPRAIREFPSCEAATVDSTTRSLRDSHPNEERIPHPRSASGHCATPVAMPTVLRETEGVVIQSCPVCNRNVKSINMDKHLDVCLRQTHPPDPVESSETPNMPTISTGHTEALEEDLTNSPLEKDTQFFHNLEHKVINGVVLDIKWDALGDLKDLYSYMIICRDDDTGHKRELEGPISSQHATLSLHKPLTTFECSVAASTSEDSGVPVDGPSTTFNVTTGEIPAPTHVTLLQRTSTSLTYSWSVDTTPSTWQVSAKPIEDDTTCDLDNIEGTGESQEKTVAFNITDLTPGSEYNVSIRNCHDAYCSRPTFVSAATDLPGLTTSLKLAFINGTTLDASWDSPEGCWDFDGYTVKCRSLNAGQVESQDLDSTPHVLLPLRTPKEKFECSIEPFVLTSGGQRRNGATLNFQVSTEGLFPPKDVKLVERTDTSLTFSWTVDPDSTTWTLIAGRLSRSGFADSVVQNSGENAGESITHKVTNLDPWTRYNVSIMNCLSTYCSDHVQMIGATDVAAPSKPQNLSCLLENNVAARFTWDRPDKPNGPVEGYSLRVYNKDQEETKLFSVPGNTTSVTVNLTHEFSRLIASLKAYNILEGSGEKVYSHEAEVLFETLGKGPVPPRPKAVEVTDRRVTLSWEWPKDPRHYITHFVVSVSGHSTASTTESQVSLENLDPWKHYSIGVASCVNDTYCGEEGTLLIDTDFGAPSKPLNLTVESTGTHWVLARWEAPEILDGPLSGYNVSFKNSSNQFEATTTELSYNFTECVPGSSYEVSVYAFNEVKGVTKRGPAATVFNMDGFDRSRILRTFGMKRSDGT